MVKFQVKSNPVGQYYFPKEVRAELGDKLTLVCNAKAAVVFAEDTSLTTVIESIEIIVRDLRHRVDIQKEASKSG
jgi:phosphopantetheine adenylyltransferase